MMNIEERNPLLAAATLPGSFYRALPRAVSSESEWEAVPLLSKSELLQVPLSQRAFVPLSDVDYIATSSGTTGTPPLFSPRTRLLEYEFRTRFHTFTGAALSSKLVMHQQEHFLRKRNLPPRVIEIDPQHPAASVRLARAARVESIFAFVHHMPLITPLMREAGAADDIRFIELAGESCPRSLFNTMREIFPNATIISTYGTSEVENSPMGIPCRAMSEREPLEVYHAKESCHLEIIDPETLQVVVPVAGAEGELVVTAYGGAPAAFPMIRYRSGDRVRVVEERCFAHGTWSFTVLGRVDMDSVKIAGGIIKADEIERVLRSIPELSDIFEAHIFEGDRPRLELHVEATGTADFPALAGRIARLLRVGPASTYQDGVEKGVYLPLSCTPLTPTPGGKRRRIVRA